MGLFGYFTSALGLMKIVKRYWKIVLGLLIVALLFWGHWKLVNNYGEEQYQRGVDATLAKMKTEVKARNSVNREVEKRAADGLGDFAKRKEREDVERSKKEKAREDRVIAGVYAKPSLNSEECSIPPQVLDDRNAIRELGPTEEDE